MVTAVACNSAQLFEVNMGEVFKNRELVKEQMALPGEVSYSFIGVSAPEYHARVEAIIVETVGEENVRHRECKPSRKGDYVSYRFKIFHMEFEEVESLYRKIGKLKGTRFMV